jgi:hypothetical protein
VMLTIFTYILDICISSFPHYSDYLFFDVAT